MIDPKSLENIGSSELSQMMSDYEKQIQAAATVEYKFDLEIGILRGKILDIRKEANELEQGYKKARKIRQELEASHRVIKTTYFNQRNGGQ